MGITLSERISQQLSDEIVRGTFRPGARLEEKDIADRFGVSRTPVRDALRQLAVTGLVEMRPHKGVMVRNVGIEQLSDMFDAMGELDALCARLAAQRMSAVERKKLEICHERGNEAAEEGDDARYAELNEEFHAIIYAGSHNVSLRDITQSFRRRLAPFRASLFFKLSGRLQSSCREHYEIARAILDCDTVRAHEAMRNHVASSSLNVIDFLMSTRDHAQTGTSASDDSRQTAEGGLMDDRAVSLST